jgi:hypothetical protein
MFEANANCVCFASATSPLKLLMDVRKPEEICAAVKSKLEAQRKFIRWHKAQPKDRGH